MGRRSAARCGGRGPSGRLVLAPVGAGCQHPAVNTRGNAPAALVAALALSACTATSEPAPLQPAPTAAAGVPLTGHRLCGDHVVVDFATDDEMRAAVAGVAADDRVRRVYTETKEQALQRFKEIFAEQPEIRDMARVEALPAGLKVMPRPGVDVRGMAGGLRSDHPSAKRVEAFVRPSAPDAPDAPECPADGEWPVA